MSVWFIWYYTAKIPFINMYQDVQPGILLYEEIK